MKLAIQVVAWVEVKLISYITTPLDNKISNGNTNISKHLRNLQTFSSIHKDHMLS